jgi:hypothetical protein
MNTPDWMTDAPAHEPKRARSARNNRRSTDRRRLNLKAVMTVAAMLVAAWGVYELTLLLIH